MKQQFNRLKGQDTTPGNRRPLRPVRMCQSGASDSRKGTAMVELAVCLPVFLLTLMGIVEFGRAMSVAQMLNAAAREGCRLAIVDESTNADITAVIKDQIVKTVGCPAESINVTIRVNVGSTEATRTDLTTATYRDLISIDVAVAHSAVSYSLNHWLEGSTLRGKCVMRHE